MFLCQLSYPGWPSYFWPRWWVPAVRLPSPPSHFSSFGGPAQAFYLMASCQESETEATKLLKAYTWKSGSITITIFHGWKSVRGPAQTQDSTFWEVACAYKKEGNGWWACLQTIWRHIPRRNPFPVEWALGRYTRDKLYVWPLFSTVLIK